MNSLAQSITMLLIGGVALRISLTDVFLRYVKEGLRPYLIAAGVILMIAALATMIRDLRPRAAADGDTDEHGADGPDEHGHAHRDPAVAWLLVLPVAAIFLIAPPALGSYAANRATSASLAQTSDFPPLPAGDPVPMAVIDYATRAVWDKGKTMQGRTIRVSGFLTPRPGGGFYLTRIMLTCCAADGRPIKLGMEGDVPQGAKADDWVELEGEYSARVDHNDATRETIAFIRVKSHRPIAQPAEPYE